MTQTYGFAPATLGNAWGDGKVYNDSLHPYDFSTGLIQLTPEQYNQVIQEINNAIANHPYYSVPASVGRTRLQCAVFNNSPQPLYSADCFASPPYKV